MPPIISILLHLLLLTVPQVYSFANHLGLLVTGAEIERAQLKIKAKQDPWFSSWNKLISIKYSSASYTNNAVSTINRSENGDLLWHDVAAAFALALRWQISGDSLYADAAANILVAWGERLKSLGDPDDKYLMAGLQGYELANAAELLRDYHPFKQNGLDTVIHMLTTVVLPLNENWLNHGEPSEHNLKHFFANWELCNVASAMAIGVLADNLTAWDFAVNYFKNGSGNGAIGNAITNIVQEPGTTNLLGQGQEEGRDQGHSALDYQLLGVIGKQAWSQNVDLFGYDNSRILRGYVRY
jgi:Alginate lyase